MSTRVPASGPQLIVRRLSAGAVNGVLHYGNLRLPCALGRSGTRARKREGDGATPAGRLAILYVLYNPGRTRRPAALLPVSAIAPSDGWCDAPRDGNYNRPVKRPYRASTEAMRRDDGLYDLVAVLDYNIVPRSRFRGSAIFMHVVRPGYLPTEGCIALSRAGFLRLLAQLRPGATVLIPA